MPNTRLTSGQTLPYLIPNLLFLKIARLGPRVLGHNMGGISRDWQPRLTVEGLTYAQGMERERGQNTNILDSSRELLGRQVKIWFRWLSINGGPKQEGLGVDWDLPGAPLLDHWRKGESRSLSTWPATRLWVSYLTFLNLPFFFWDGD